jgi:hypothetical protein
MKTMLFLKCFVTSAGKEGLIEERSWYWSALSAFLISTSKVDIGRDGDIS